MATLEQGQDLKGESVDINDAFDSIVLSEEHFVKEGFKEGFQKGVEEGKHEGFHLGYHRGAELGAELGYYRGVAEALLADDNRKGITDKAVDALNSVLSLLNQFPTTNDKEVDTIGLRDQIRAKYKKACSHLKMTGFSPDASKLSF